jgi:peptidoglycan/LPS O-acetylase OafA/YrhL
MPHIHGLNTLRFFSFLSIFLFHATKTFKYGYLGVDFFFVLSSFLLTYLMLLERERTGGFSKINFFVRRALRIFPLYYLIIIFSFFLLPVISSYYGYSPSLPEKKILYWFFLSNYDLSDGVYYLKFLWSIAVEEQFYLLFLLLSRLVLKNVGFVVGVLLIIYYLFMLYAQKNNISTYTHLITHFPNFSAGMITAFIFFRKNYKIQYVIGLFLFLIIGIFLVRNDIFLIMLNSILFSTILLIIIYLSKYIEKSYLFKLTEHLGNYSYGLYVYSGVVITFFSLVIPKNNIFITLFGEFFILLMISIVSFRFFEYPFLKLKKHFTR